MDEDYQAEADDYVVTDDEGLVIDENIEKWIQIERWFLQILGVALLVIGILGLFLGIIHNPDNETAVTVANIIFSVGLGAGGIWNLYISRKTSNIIKRLENYLKQGNDSSYVYAGIQFLVAFLFILEGFSRGQIVMIMLALSIFGSAGFFIWRAQQITKLIQE